MSKRTDDPALTVTLPRSGWIALIGALSELPYGRVSDTIEEIVRQAGAQLEAREPATDTPGACARAN